MELIIILWIFLSKSFFLNFDASIKIYTTIIGFGVALLIPISFIRKNLTKKFFETFKPNKIVLEHEICRI